MGITGRTSSKLFKVKTLDINEPYKVGENNVTSITQILGNGDNVIKKVSYELDGIKYSSFILDIPQKEIYSKLNLNETQKGVTLTNKKLTKQQPNSFTKEINIPGTIGASIQLKQDLLKGDPIVLTKSIKKSDSVIPSLKALGTFVKKSLNSTIVSTQVMNTIFETTSLSYEQFVEKDIYKEEKYVGLIDKPIVTSEVFMERDIGSIFERHRRLEEINNINELENYRNGYYKNINTI
tara:strand:- start:3635 stop:4345 length:711 start_codon:yes stop_codon:yes gene_type:complete